ncbi:hypothetical protein G9P44_002769 [Scheffersomyces stipitis]|nr:hypothetical protein G9P44_002769 [Scheffersomyces stipitis]
MNESPASLRTSPSISLQKHQELILLELEMIRDTVKQIDANLVKAIELLQIGPVNSMNDSPDYKQVVRRSVHSITTILKSLDGYTGDA